MDFNQLIVIIIDLIDKLTEAIPLVKTVNPFQLHEEVSKMYDWHEVAERTEKVYDRMQSMEQLRLIDKLKK